MQYEPRTRPKGASRINRDNHLTFLETKYAWRLQGLSPNHEANTRQGELQMSHVCDDAKSGYRFHVIPNQSQAFIQVSIGEGAIGPERTITYPAGN